MSAIALSQRENWQAVANKGGATHEVDVSSIFQELFTQAGYQHYEWVSKPKMFKNYFTEEAYKLHPERFTKSVTPQKGDLAFDQDLKKFVIYKDGWKPTNKEGLHGFEPDGLIRNTKTNKSHLIEDKHQEAAGNAHERGCRYGMPKIVSAVQKKLGITTWPVTWIFAGGMTENRKYIEECEAVFPDDHFIMLPKTNHSVLKEWFDRVLVPLLA